MLEKDINALLQKADELKALFVLGQRVVPFLEEIFVFIRDIKPLLDEVNDSVIDNLRKMPRASTQLTKVTQATEMATTEIMDTVEELIDKADDIGKSFSRLKSHLGGQNGNAAELDDILAGIDDRLEGIKSDSGNIMMALQVQDITSQQIAAVNHLLATIQDKLERVLAGFRPQDFADAMHRTGRENVSTLHRDIAFDPDAISVLDRPAAHRQAAGDTNQASGQAENFSQDDIDELFRQQ